MSSFRTIRAEPSAFAAHLAAAGPAYIKVNDERPLSPSLLSMLNNMVKPVARLPAPYSSASYSRAIVIKNEPDVEEPNILNSHVITKNAIIKNESVFQGSYTRALNSKKRQVCLARDISSLKAQADKAPHVHYPSRPTANAASGSGSSSGSGSGISSSSNSGSSSAATAIPAPRVRFAQLRPKTSQNRITKSKRKSRATNTTNRRLPLRQPRNTTRVFLSSLSLEPRAPDDTRPLIKFYSTSAAAARPKLPRFYRRVFLAGPPEKTGPDDKRIFYRREFLGEKDRVVDTFVAVV